MNQKPSKRNFQNYRAPKLGELLNIFHTSEEVENKKMFEVKEKDYNMRMIESHIFPKRHSIEFLNKLYNLLKNKDPNYYLKRKYINHANFENFFYFVFDSFIFYFYLFYHKIILINLDFN